MLRLPPVTTATLSFRVCILLLLPESCIMGGAGSAARLAMAAATATVLDCTRMVMLAERHVLDLHRHNSHSVLTRDGYHQRLLEAEHTPPNRDGYIPANEFPPCVNPEGAGRRQNGRQLRVTCCGSSGISQGHGGDTINSCVVSPLASPPSSASLALCLVRSLSTRTSGVVSHLANPRVRNPQRHVLAPETIAGLGAIYQPCPS